MKKHKLQSGLGLVEIMIALLIGLFLMGGLIQMFITSKQTYKIQDVIGRLQENQRFAMDFLVRDIRGLGGWGCFRDVDTVQNLLNSTGDFTMPTAGITGTDNHVSTGANDLILVGTDTFTISNSAALQNDDGLDVAVKDIPDTTSAPLPITANKRINEGDILLVGDCEEASLFQVSGITAGTDSDTLAHNTEPKQIPGNARKDFVKTYDKNARVYSFSTRTYSIREGEGGEPSLFRSINAGDTNELIEGVEDMQILYGEDTNDDGTPNYYVSANRVSNWNQVVSVQISLLMRSENNQIAVSIPYTFNGVVVEASKTDKRIRRSVTSVISIRNRLY